ncbi:MAG: SPOR domain-containing protein [Halanaerobiales bacterium]
MNRGNTFSLTIMVIIMALLAIFVGYLLGNWLIQLVTGEVSHQQAQEGEVAEEDSIKEEIINEEMIEDEENSNSVPSSSEEVDTEDREEESDSTPSEEKPEDSDQQDSSGEVYVIQIGAFSESSNAEKFKEELEEEGFQATINSEESIYKVQMAVTGEEEMEKQKSALEELGYKVYVTH